MKLNKKHYVTLFAFLLCITCFLSACGGPAGKIQQNTHAKYYYEDVDNTDSSETDDNSSLSNKEKLALKAELEKLKKSLPNELPIFADDDESFAYKVIYSDSVSNSVSAEVKTLRSTIQKKLSASVTAVIDTKSAEEKQELLIGNTNRKASSEALATLKANRKNCYDDFIVRETNGKIVIVGGSDDATIKAVKWFAETFCKSERTWTYLRQGYELLYAPKYNTPAIKLGGADIYNFNIVTPKRAEFVYGRAVDDLIDYVKKSLHYRMTRDDEGASAAKYEILVGNLDRNESKSVTPNTNEYVINVIGSKLVIKGYDSVCLYYGVKEFSGMLDNAVKSGKALSLANGYILRKTVDTSNSSICRLTFNDEFDGESLSSIWDGYDGGTSGENSVLGGGIVNAGKSLCYLENGILHMPSGRSGEKDFNESKITLKNSLWYKYGCLEVSAKMPLNPAHAAIWINGWAEIDILENFSSETGFSSNIHKWFTQYLWDGSANYAHTSLDGNSAAEDRRFKYDTEKYKDNLTSDFHIYSLDWTPEYFRFAVDGKVFFRYDYKENEDEVDFFKQELYLILTSGIGSNSYGARYNPELHDGKVYDCQFDYVRLYQTPSTDGLYYK